MWRPGKKGEGEKTVFRREGRAICLLAPPCSSHFAGLGVYGTHAAFPAVGCGRVWAVGCTYVVVVAVFFPSSHRAKHSFLLLFLPPALKLFFAQ